VSQSSNCDGCNVREECELAIKIDKLMIEYEVNILIPYCEYKK